MIRRNLEFWYALAAIAAITALYALSYARLGGLPGASGLIGHGIGVAGFILMLMTATLYSIRKQRTGASWGSMAFWLRFHMVTGLVGPYMVLLHTAMRFGGLAGVTMLLTVVVTASGLIGRYIYTRVPRTAGGGADVVLRGAGGAVSDGPGAASASHMLQRKALATWRSIHVPLTWALFTAAFIHIAAALYYATLGR